MKYFKSLFFKIYGFFHKKYHHLIYGQCVVLLYHRVTNLPFDPQLLAVTPSHFDAHLILLNKKYNLITIQELAEYLTSNKRIPKNSVAITFDDGYADNFLEALPILEKHNAQALFYIMSGNLNTYNEYWWDKVERIFYFSSITPSKNIFYIDEREFDLSNWSEVKRDQLYNELLPVLRRMSSQKRDQLIDELGEIFNVTSNRESNRSLSFEELKLMNKSKSAVIGCHTEFHPSLSSLNYSEQKNEILNSKIKIEEIIKEQISHFSFPFGTVSDYNQETLEICKDLKFKIVAANYPSIVNKRVHSMYFPRFLVRDWDEVEFSDYLNSFFKQ
jgi:peptidoglycan/xylan/chitin deacetylase (PgdA/CDA1 family)